MKMDGIVLCVDRWWKCDGIRCCCCTGMHNVVWTSPQKPDQEVCDVCNVVDRKQKTQCGVLQNYTTTKSDKTASDFIFEKWNASAQRWQLENVWAAVVHDHNAIMERVSFEFGWNLPYRFCFAWSQCRWMAEKRYNTQMPTNRNVQNCAKHTSNTQRNSK